MLKCNCRQCADVIVAEQLPDPYSSPLEKKHDDEPPRGARQGPARILYLTFDARVGGPEKLLLQMVQGLDRERYVPEVLTLKPLRALTEPLGGVGGTRFSVLL